MRLGRESFLVQPTGFSCSKAGGKGNREREREIAYMAIAATCNKVQMNDWWVVPRDRWLDVIRARSIGKQLVRSCHTLCNELTSDLTN